MYVKISNLISKKNNLESYDYKGIDINKIFPCSQRYFTEENYCILEVENEDLSSPDIHVMTQDEYLTLKNKSQNTEPEIIENDEVNIEKIAIAEAIIDLENRVSIIEGGN